MKSERERTPRPRVRPSDLPDSPRPRCGVAFVALVLIGAAGLLRPTFALNPALQLHQYNCRTWDSQGGLPASGVRAITQGAGGYLWLGTQTGIVRFDGIRFTRFTLPSSGGFRTQVIFGLAPGTEPGVWFGVASGAVGFCGANGDIARVTHVSWIHPANTVNAVLRTEQGDLLVATDEGLGIYRPTAPERSTFDADLTNVRSLHQDARHRVWLVNGKFEIYYHENGRTTRFADADAERQQATAVVADAADRLWVGTNAGLLCYGMDHRRLEIPPFPHEVKDLLVDRHGVLWIATSDQGLACYRNGRYQYLTKDDGLADNAVTTLFEDHEGNLWVGTRRGLNELSDVKFPVYSAPEGILGGMCHGVAASARGGLWIATSDGLSYFDGRRAENFTPANGLPVPYVKRAFEASNGDVYLIDGRRDIVILEDGRKVVASFTEQTWPTAFAEDSRGIVVSLAGTLRRVDRQGLSPFLVGNRTPAPFTWIRNLTVSHDGALWVATVNGLARYLGDEEHRWSLGAGALENDVYSVCEDNAGTIWASTAAGVARVQGNSVTRVTQRDGLPDDLIYTLAPDLHGNFWMNSSRGVFRVAVSELNAFCDGRTARVNVTTFTGPNSVKTIDTTEVEYQGCRTQDGRIWFPTPLGAMAVNPADIPTSTYAPVVLVEQIDAGGKIIPLDGPHVVDPGARDLAFEYTAASFVAPQLIHFRYRLDGFDDGWVDANTRRRAQYTNLAPGHYSFHVQVANADGVWNERAATAAVNLRPYFYQTIWFKSVLALVAVTVLAGIYLRWARREMRKDAERERNRLMLEEEVRKRTAELQQEIGERRRAEESLRLSEAFLQSLLENLPVQVVRKDRDGRITYANASYCRFHGITMEQAIGHLAADHMPQSDAERERRSDAAVLETGHTHDAMEMFHTPSGAETFSRVIKVPVLGADGKTIVGSQAMALDVTSLKEAEERLEQLNRTLRQTSREAGMAEVATGVLHNVGNVLNSVNVSATLIADHVRHSKSVNIGKLAALLNQHAGDLGTFLTTDDRGRMIPRYISDLAELLEQERTAIVAEIEQLRKNVEHIKEIVAMQQSYARTSGVMETVSVPDMIEDALRINAGSLARHDVDAVRDYRARPVITTDKHKVMQILINLVRNAKYACDESGRTDKQIRVTTTADNTAVRIAISDNGVGIAAENLTRIFSHGFTTRKHGHGFGLHSGALAARELGGSLTVQSDGPGKGATFVLELPYKTDSTDHDEHGS